jgi:hypothetical protein
MDIFPEFNIIAWDKFEKYFNYFEVLDSQFINLDSTPITLFPSTD